MKLNKFAKAVLMTCLLSSPLAAFADNPVEIKSVAMVEKVQKDATGHETKTLEPVNTVVPGQEVVFKNQISNKGKIVAKDIAVTNPLPEHMMFVSAYGPSDIVITYSINGHDFASGDKLMTKDEVSGNNRLASPNEYKFVRWSLPTALAANASVEVGYKAVLK